MEHGLHLSKPARNERQNYTNENQAFKYTWSKWLFGDVARYGRKKSASKASAGLLRGKTGEVGGLGRGGFVVLVFLYRTPTKPHKKDYPLGRSGESLQRMVRVRLSGEAHGSFELSARVVYSSENRRSYPKLRSGRLRSDQRVFGFSLEYRSDSLRNERSPSPEPAIRMRSAVVLESGTSRKSRISSHDRASIPARDFAARPASRPDVFTTRAAAITLSCSGGDM